MKLPRSRRMTSARDFRRVRTAGQSFAGAYLVLAVLPPDEGSNNPTAQGTFGFVTPKRIGNAVDRNRVRRQLRAIVRDEGERLLPFQHAVTIARPRSVAAPFAALRREWRWLARRAALLPPRPIPSQGQGQDPGAGNPHSPE